jgi:hypothetical protein
VLGGYSWCIPGFHRLSMFPCHHHGKERQGGAQRGAAAPRSGRPLTTASSHRLCVVGRGLDQDGFPVVFCPICIDVIGVSLVPLHKSASESAFRWIISCICVYDLQNMFAPKLVEGC